jgi:3-oxoacyl-[acyl-carrier-protein] synthase-3
LRYENVCIEGLGHGIPEQIVTSAELEKRVESIYKALSIEPGLLENLVGVRERRWWPADYDYSDMSVVAGQKVLENTGIDKSEIQVLINTSICRDYIEPATASIIHHKLGLSPSCFSFDMGNACLAFINGIGVVANMIELGQIDTGMVVAGECAREINEAIIDELLSNEPDFKLFYQTMGALSIGGGSVAMILRSREKSATGKRVLSGYSYCDTQHHNLCVGQRKWGRLQAKEMLLAGLHCLKQCWEGFLETSGWTDADIDRYFTHQVSNAHRSLGSQTIGINMDGRDYWTLDRLGNIGPVSAPICMSMALEEGFLKDGDKVCLLGMGSGINATMMAVQW